MRPNAPTALGKSPQAAGAPGDQPAYRQAVLPGEQSLFNGLPVGTVDAELKLCRLRLARAAVAEARLIADGESEGLARVQDEINRITTHIERLEYRRAQLKSGAVAAKADGPASSAAAGDPQALARAIRDALNDIEAATAPPGDGSSGDADT